MKITVFTSNQPRHVSLVETLSPLCETIFVVQECATLFPGQVEDFYHKSDVMRDYFGRMMAAEKKFFGKPRFLPVNARSLPMKLGDLNSIPLEQLEEALDADVCVVFGASYIKQPLIGALLERKAINIHMGVSPYYRGSTCNFWASADGRADLVGATIHLLSEGLDSGAMLFHAFPAAAALDPFDAGMLAVRAAHRGLADYIRKGLLGLEPVVQDKSLELRYSKRAEFSDDAASEYLKNLPSPQDVQRQMEKRNLASFVRPFVDEPFAG